MKIHGRSPEEFFRELGKPVRVSRKEGTDTTYVSVSAVEGRVAELLLPSNYNFECGEPRLFKAGKRTTFIITGKLTLIDDEGKAVCTRQLPGGSDLSFLKNDKEMTANELKTFITAAKSAAFVNCWLAMGLGDKSELHFGSRKTQTESRPYEVKFTSAFSYSERAGLLKATAEVAGKTVEFKIFKDGLEGLAKKYGKTVPEVVKCLVANYGPGKARPTWKCAGTLGEYKGAPQFVFEKEA